MATYDNGSGFGTTTMTTDVPRKKTPSPTQHHKQQYDEPAVRAHINKTLGTATQVSDRIGLHKDRYNAAITSLNKQHEAAKKRHNYAKYKQYLDLPKEELHAKLIAENHPHAHKIVASHAALQHHAKRVSELKKVHLDHFEETQQHLKRLHKFKDADFYHIGAALDQHSISSSHPDVHKTVIKHVNDTYSSKNIEKHVVRAKDSFKRSVRVHESNLRLAAHNEKELAAKKAAAEASAKKEAEQAKTAAEHKAKQADIDAKRQEILDREAKTKAEEAKRLKDLEDTKQAQAKHDKDLEELKKKQAETDKAAAADRQAEHKARAEADRLHQERADAHTAKLAEVQRENASASAVAKAEADRILDSSRAAREPTVGSGGGHSGGVTHQSTPHVTEKSLMSKHGGKIGVGIAAVTVGAPLVAYWANRKKRHAERAKDSRK
jgi:hypothetical protein